MSCTPKVNFCEGITPAPQLHSCLSAIDKFKQEQEEFQETEANPTKSPEIRTRLIFDLGPQKKGVHKPAVRCVAMAG